MLICMRTSINLPDALLTEAKARAAAQGRTLTSLIEEGLRSVLEDRATDGQPLEPLPAFGDPNSKFLIDITDREALWQALDAENEE